MKNCELCSGGLARMHCESDQASLCWDCDSKVHGANFLVAKHTRTLLCHICQNPTPWLASGQHIAAAVSVCESCVANNDSNTTVMTPEPEESSEGEYDDDDGEEEGEDDDYDEEEEEEEEDDDDAENQVVPEDSSSFSMSKPVASSDSLSSNEVGVGGGCGGSGLKRMRESLSFCSDDEIGCYSSLVRSGESTSSTSSSSRLLKQPRLAGVNNSARNQDHLETESRSTAIITSLKRLQNHMIINDDDASATIMGICSLSRDQSR